MRTTIWLLFIALAAYNWLDYVHTMAAMELGILEANFLLNFLIHLTGSVHVIAIVKLFWFTLLGFCLYLQTRRSAPC